MAKRGNGGFTLVELLVTIVAGSLITLAASAILLLALKVNFHSSGTVRQQNTGRIVLTMMEKLASEGSIQDVASDLDTDAQDGFLGWQLKDESGGTILSYYPLTGTIYSGAYTVAGEEVIGTPLMEGVISSVVDLNKRNGVLTFTVETEEGSYDTSVYCRTMERETDAPIDEEIQDIIQDNESESVSDMDARNEFVKTLVTQYRMPDGSVNRGIILEERSLGDFTRWYSTGTYYSQWYIGDKYWKVEPGWDEKTPWCACFASWGLNQMLAKELVLNPPLRTSGKVRDEWFSSVDDFRFYFEAKDGENGDEKDSWIDCTEPEFNDFVPTPGDLILFDWNFDGDTQHVGTVMSVTETAGKKYVFTIEGNSSGIVAVRKYSITDPRIFGYGVLDWKADESAT